MSPADHQALVDALIQDEGRKPRIYLDSRAKWTIGIGRNLSDRDVSDAVINLMLEEDIAIAEHDARTFAWFADLNSVRQRVILNLIFNLGLSKFSLFPKLIHALAVNDYETAANEMKASKWATDVKDRATRLIAEMRTGTD